MTHTKHSTAVARTVLTLRLTTLALAPVLAYSIEPAAIIVALTGTFLGSMFAYVNYRKAL